MSSFDGESWTDVAIPDHFFFGLDCQRLFLDGDGTIWLDWADAVLPEAGGREDFSIHARLDGETWTQYENPFDAVVGDPDSELAGLSQRRSPATAATRSSLLATSERSLPVSPNRPLGM